MPEPAAADPQIAVILRRPFAEQVAFFRGKLGNLVPTATWRDVWKSAHDRAFMVAGAAKADLLADLASAVDKAIADGETLDAFRRRFAEIVQRHGWHGWTGEETAAGRAWRTRIIYQTNLSTSYAAGRLAQLKEGGFRLWVYRHSGAEHPRLQHKAWNGLTLPADHPFWQTHAPPNGWGCGCRILGASGPETARIAGGKPGYTEPPAGWDDIDPKTGEQVGIDKGWGYMPGGTVVDQVRALAPKLAQLPPGIGVALGEDLRPGIVSAWESWIDDVLKNPSPMGRYAVVGALGAEDLAFLAQAGVAVTRSDISIEDRLIVGKKAGRHQDQGNALSDAEWRNLARLLSEPEAVLYDTETGNLLYVLPSTGGRAIKTVVAPNFTAKKRPVEHSVRSVFHVGVEALMDRRRYRVIRGRLNDR